MGNTLIPPGPKGHFLTGHLPEMRRDLLGFYLRCAREYGDCTTLRFGLKRIFFVNHPELIEQVLHSRNFTKHYALRMNRLLLGNGLLTSEGDFWLRQRRLIQPVFQRERILSYAPDMTAFTQQRISSWHDGDVRDMHAEMRQLTLAIAAKTLFGADVTGQSEAVGQALHDAMGTFSQRFFRVIRIPERWPTPGNLRIRKAIRRLDNILYGLIQERRVEGEQKDLLSILLHARHESDGTGMTDQQLRDEAMTLFLAGHETTALALSWGWYLLAQHPEVVEKLQTELHQVLGGRPPAADDLPRLVYTDMVVHEIMRVYPPAYAVGRQAIDACTIGGYPVPAGATILMSQWVVHRDPRYFVDPERFYPERWADGLAKRLPRYAYFPFGGGQRVCIGNTFALMELPLVLASIAQRFRFSLPPGPPVLPKPQLTLQPNRPILLKLHALR
ncbi:MAG TPA: cytochrome P450 [Gemmataceae bacterium]|nr:cytochrome P450 [Gemmataceae bacterium]